MGEIIWVEILSRQRNVEARHRCMGPLIHIGRAYHNDVVLDDPFVAPQHLRISRNESGLLVAEDLGSTNGIAGERCRAREERIVVDGDRPIRIGHTTLRIREEGYPVAPERPIQPQRRLWPYALAIAAAILAIEIGALWLGQTTEPKLTLYLTPLLILSLLTLGWTGGWAVLARIFAGQAYFERNLIIALSGLLAYSLYDELVGLTSFSLSWRLLATYQYVGSLCILAVTCFRHLRTIGPARSWLKGGILAALVCLAVATQTLRQSEAGFGFESRLATHRLLPPSLRLTPLKSEDTFFADVERLKKRLDHARTEESPFPGMSLDFGDDD
ncbi:MAG: FHA domain-containing protein [Alphaproteobacteria bacterium]|nr:FHA domain-containing protein [Alphaproteobacteria bacterium]